MPREINKVLVEVPQRTVKSCELWVHDPENEDELKNAFQWKYGYWPDDIKFIHVIDKVVEDDKK